MELIERFWSKTKQVEGGCIEWTAAKTGKGYGRFKVQGKLKLPHRFIMEWINQTTYPRSIDIRHRCDNPPCVNPAHLIPGTRRENMIDWVERVMPGLRETQEPRKPKTHCKYDHPYSGENLYVDDKGGRRCRACRARGMREYRERDINS